MIRWRDLRAPLLAGALALAAAGCDTEPQGSCQETYRHLLQIGHKNHDPDLEARFVAACVAAWDSGQVACLLRAQTPEQATACRPTKTRPG